MVVTAVLREMWQFLSPPTKYIKLFFISWSFRRRRRKKNLPRVAPLYPVRRRRRRRTRRRRRRPTLKYPNPYPWRGRGHRNHFHDSASFSKVVCVSLGFRQKCETYQVLGNSPAQTRFRAFDEPLLKHLQHCENISHSGSNPLET